MATDKALPNEPRKEFEIPGEEEIQEQVVEEVQKEQESPNDIEKWIMFKELIHR